MLYESDTGMWHAYYIYDGGFQWWLLCSKLFCNSETNIAAELYFESLNIYVWVVIFLDYDKIVTCVSFWFIELNVDSLVPESVFLDHAVVLQHKYLL